MKLFGGGVAEKPQEQKSLLNFTSVLADKTVKNKSLCPSLSLKTRIKGWAILICIGFVVSLISAGLLKSLIRGDIVKFGILYTVGTCCSLGSSMFLWGPAAQCKSMFDKTRRITTIIFLTAIIGVILCIVFYDKIPAAT
mgnify:FL=1